MNKKTLFLTLLISTFILSTISYVSAEGKTTYRDLTNIPLTSARCNEFTFDATGSYDPDNRNISFLWDFGDGIQTTDAVSDHIYSESGDYKVTLTITDGSGLECSSAVTEQTVRVNIPPFASLYNENKSCVDKPIVFDASTSSSPSGKKLDFIWNFGDGTTAQGKSVISKTYAKGGTYDFSVTIDDTTGSICSTNKITKKITINEPPEAIAGDSLLLQCVSKEDDLLVMFDASKSKDINNDTLSYFWDFGDGTKGEGVQASHRYASSGNYEVKLTAKDDSGMEECNSNTTFITVRLNESPKANAGDDIISCVGEDIIMDGSNSYANIKGTLDASWFFGDGQSSKGLKTHHIYSNPGKYEAVLSVENKLNSTCQASRDTKSITINSAPTVSIVAIDSICLGSKINFDASSAIDSDGDPLEFYWSFGDGSILRSGSKVSHEYKQGGTYRVSVIVDDGQGSSCSTVTASTTVKVNTPPIADAGPNHVCCVDTKTLFDASASSDPDGETLTYLWDFGDGIKKRGSTVEHSYSKSGSYNIFLTVDDNSGTTCNQSTAGFIAEVNTSPVPIIKIR